jgi:hypothetical protein|tara:strand:- start:398 stop:619 length:222 start_codon:yes stop_codon:yes gene_type:complete
MIIKKYKTIQNINFYIEQEPIYKKYQRILYKDKSNNWNYTYKNNFDNFDYLNSKDINNIRFYSLVNNINIKEV